MQDIVTQFQTSNCTGSRGAPVCSNENEEDDENDGLVSFGTSHGDSETIEGDDFEVSEFFKCRSYKVCIFSIHVPVPYLVVAYHLQSTSATHGGRVNEAKKQHQIFNFSNFCIKLNSC